MPFSSFLHRRVGCRSSVLALLLLQSAHAAWAQDAGSSDAPATSPPIGATIGATIGTTGSPMVDPSPIPTQSIGSYADTVSFGAVGGRPHTAPFSLNAEANVSYDDNILRLADRAPTPTGDSRGDFYSTLTGGFSASTPLGLQLFYVDGTYSRLTYDKDTLLNTGNYLVEGGVDWKAMADCLGNFSTSYTARQTPLEELLAVALNQEKTLAVSEKGSCRIGSRLTAGLDGSWSQHTNTLARLRTNDNNEETVKGSIGYGVSGLYSTGIETTYSHWDYSNRGDATVSGLALSPSIDQEDASLFYQRVFSPVLQVRAKAGAVMTSSTNFSSSPSPSYGLTMSWQATPKITIDLIAEHDVTAAQAILADYVSQDNYAITGNWAFTPVLSFGSSVGYTEQDYHGGTTGLKTDSITGNLAAQYRITPLVQAIMTYRYLNQDNSSTSLFGGRLHSDTIMIGLKFTR
jgi:hypothetical protein